MTGYHCPIEGCDYGDQDEKSLAAVRAHINASNSDSHDWEQLKAAVEDQSEREDEQDGEADEEQPQATENDRDDMVSQQEYERQQQGQSKSEENSRASGDSNGGSTDEGASTSVDEFLPDLSLSTYILLASAILAAFIIWRVWRSRQQSEPVDVDEDDEPSDRVDRNEVTMLE